MVSLPPARMGLRASARLECTAMQVVQDGELQEVCYSRCLSLRPIRAEEGILSGPLIVAICSVVVAIIVPSALFFAAKFLDRRSLQVSLTACNAPFPLAMRAFLREQLRAKYALVGEPLSNLQFSRQQFELIPNISGYMKLTLHNPRSKKLTAVTVNLKSSAGPIFGFLYQIDDELALLGPTELKIVLGDLQPHQSRSLHLWAGAPCADYYYKNLPPMFDVTADEYDKRPMKFPFPNYLKTYIEYRASRYFMWASISISLTFLFYQIARFVAAYRM